MKILVCFKVMPIFDKVLEQDWEVFAPTIDISYAGMEFNCFDQSALELGLRIKESAVVQGHQASCTALTVGAFLQDSMAQNLYAVGFDEVVNIENNQPEFACDAIADTISEYAKKGQYDLILTGITAGMAQTGMVPFIVAGELSYPVVPDIETASFEKNNILALCHRSDGLWQKTVRLPVVLSVGNSPMVLRCSTLRARMSFKGHSAQNIPANKTNIKNEKVLQLNRPKSARHCKMLSGEPLAQVDEVIKLLKNAKKHKQESTQDKDFLQNLPDSSVYYALSAKLMGFLDTAFLALVDDWKENKPKLIVLPDTQDGRQLAVRLATHLGCSCDFGATLTQASSQRVTLQKRVCASNLVWTKELQFPAIVTTLQTFETIRNVPVKVENARLENWIIYQKILIPAFKSGLDNPDVVVVCGSGMENKEDCQKAREVAKKLDAGFGLTRPAALDSWGSTDEIIGQSGKLISPCVCLVLGAAGASAFSVGIERAGKIIAVNTDSNALVFNDADIGVKMDAKRFVEMMLQALEN